MGLVHAFDMLLVPCPVTMSDATGTRISTGISPGKEILGSILRKYFLSDSDHETTLVNLPPEFP